MPVVVPDADVVQRDPQIQSPVAASRSNRLPYLLLLPGLLWLLLFFVVPLISVATASLQVPRGLSPESGYAPGFRIENYTDALAKYWPEFIRSFVYAGIATALALALAFPLAYFIAFRAGKWRNLLLILVVAPFFCSFLIRTYAWKTILADDGAVTTFFNALGVLPQDRILATPIAVVTGLTYNFLPFMVLPLYASLERIDPRLIEAGADLYAVPFTGFRKITVPLAMPGIIAGTLLTFIPATGDFINAELLGNPKTRMIGNVIQSQFSRGDYPVTSSLSFALMAVILVIVFLYIRRSGTEDLV